MPCKKCALNLKMRHFEENLKNWLFSNHCLCHLVPCMSMKLGTFVQLSFLVITNKFASIYLNIFGICNPKSEKWKNTKKWPCSHVEAGKTCGFIPGIPSVLDLKHGQKRFNRIPSLNVSEMRHLGIFKSILSNGFHGDDDRYKNFDFSFGHVFLC